MDNPTMVAIEDLLEEERAALLAGDFEALADLVERKQALTDELLRDGTQQSALQRLRRRAERNAGLIEASIRGMRTVARRLAEIRRANGPLQTYSQNGAKQTFGAAPGTFERRA